MRPFLYVVASLAGAVIALLGSEPIWIAAVVALIVFPLAAAAADRRSRSRGSRRQASLAPALATAVAGGLLVALLARLALAAPGWLSEASADCGGASTGVQQLVLWSSAIVFLLAATPVGITLVEIAARLRDGRSEDASPVPLVLYPVAVSASGLALIAAGYVTNC